MLSDRLQYLSNKLNRLKSTNVSVSSKSSSKVRFIIVLKDKIGQAYVMITSSAILKINLPVHEAEKGDLDDKNVDELESVDTWREPEVHFKSNFGCVDDVHEEH